MTEPKGEGAIEEALKHLEERHACDWPITEGAYAELASLRTAKEELERDRDEFKRMAEADRQALKLTSIDLDAALAAKETAERERAEWRDRATTAEYRLAMKHPWTMSDDEDASLRTALSHSEAERGRLEEALLNIADLPLDDDEAWDNRHPLLAPEPVRIARQALSNQPRDGLMAGTEGS